MTFLHEDKRILHSPLCLTRPSPVVPVAFLPACRDRFDLHMRCFFRKYQKAVARGVANWFLKAFIAADILISCFTFVFMARMIFGSASTQLCGSGCARNRYVNMRCETAQQPLPDGEYAKEKLCFMPQRSQKVWNSAPQNCGPRSETKIDITPNYCIQLCSIAETTALVVVSKKDTLSYNESIYPPAWAHRHIGGLFGHAQKTLSLCAR